MLTTIYQVVDPISTILTAVAAGIAIYLFFFKRKPIISIFRLLLNFSMKLSLTELNTKLDKLNDLNANDSQQRDNLLNIFHEIIGQIQGNRVLKGKFNPILTKLKDFVNDPSLMKEPDKRSLVSELRENLRTLELETYDNIFGR